MVWIAIVVLLALVTGVLGTLLEAALWAVVLLVLAFTVGGLLLTRTVGAGRARGR
jgi:hypothetical protein